MTECVDVNCWYHKQYGKNAICPITKEVHDIGQSQKRKAELKRLENCFRIIRHELLKRNEYSNTWNQKRYHNLMLLKEIREFMI